MDCSVIVLAWQESELTGRCVESLGSDPEVIVVDNGSDEPHAGALRDLCARVGARYVRAPRNLGFAGGMNLGLMAATRSVVVFSNNDIEVDPGALEKLAAKAAEAGVGAVFPAVRNGSGAVVTAGGRFLTVGRAVAHGSGISSLPNSRASLTCPVSEAEWLAGPFVVMRRALAVSLGGVPAQSFFYGEDYRLCWELRSRGYQLSLVNDACVTHIDDATASKVYSADRIARLQTAALVRAAIDHQPGGFRKIVLYHAFAFGARIRHWVRRSERSAEVLAGVTEGRAEVRRRVIVE
jgi:N-acetylglucosaminyl-diphospho-decaprenol L-rhamnosyltransferase